MFVNMNMKGNQFIHAYKSNCDIKFRVLILIALFTVRIELGGGSPSKITLYTLKNNCTKFGAFVHFVPISSKLTTISNQIIIFSF